MKLRYTITGGRHLLLRAYPETREELNPRELASKGDRLMLELSVHLIPLMEPWILGGNMNGAYLEGAIRTSPRALEFLPKMGWKQTA